MSFFEVYDQVRLFCKEKKVQNPTIAKMLLSLLLHVQSKVKPSGTLLPNLVLCLCDCMALIDDEVRKNNFILNYI